MVRVKVMVWGRVVVWDRIMLKINVLLFRVYIMAMVKVSIMVGFA
jgi:hypothetical protein